MINHRPTLNKQSSSMAICHRPSAVKDNKMGKKKVFLVAALSLSVAGVPRSNLGLGGTTK